MDLTSQSLSIVIYTTGCNKICDSLREFENEVLWETYGPKRDNMAGEC
jgi:hypothetical protein